MRYKRFWDNCPPNFTKNFIFQNGTFTSPFSLHLFYNFKTAYTIGWLRNYDPFKQHHLFTPQKVPERTLIIPQECLISTDSAHIDPDCIPSTVSQQNPHSSKVFDHPLNDKAKNI